MLPSEAGDFAEPEAGEGVEVEEEFFAFVSDGGEDRAELVVGVGLGFDVGEPWSQTTETYLTDQTTGGVSPNYDDNWQQDLNEELSSKAGRVMYAYYSFSSLGLKSFQAAALTGSLFEESEWTMMPGIRQGDCTPDFANPSPTSDCGRGIAQWGVYDRWPAMLKAEHGDSFVGEVDYVYVEMQERGDWSLLMQTETMAEAITVVVEKYEVAGFPNTKCRTNSATNVLQGTFGVPGAGC